MPLLEVEELSIGFQEAGETVTITDRVSFSLEAGEVLGLAGESGCGKTVTALALLRLLPQPNGRLLGGRVLFKGREISALPLGELRKLRGKDLAIIFQEPTSALDPLMPIGKQLQELFHYHRLQNHRSQALPSFNPQKRIGELLEQVGFTDHKRILHSYPHQLSGGMLQRVMIAMALLLRPALLIADEPTTALDVTVQAQIMELLSELQRQEGSAILLITHNLALVAQYADRLAVMYAGRIIEQGTVDAFLKQPLHPYSQGLLAALPEIDRLKKLKAIKGQVPRPSDYKNGCRFQDRCPHRLALCDEEPPIKQQGKQTVACFLY